jgi:beta-lactamase class A
MVVRQASARLPGNVLREQRLAASGWVRIDVRSIAGGTVAACFMQVPLAADSYRPIIGGMLTSIALLSVASLALLAVPATDSTSQPSSRPATRPIDSITLDYNTPVDPALQSTIEKIDTELRDQFGMKSEQTAVGVLDLLTGRVAMIHPDREEYAASIPKVGILFAYFTLHPEAATKLDPTVRHELGLMAKASSNEMASKYSHEIGLAKIQEILNNAGFYDAKHGGGIWVGKHYGKDGERHGSPVADNSHAATVRQLLRYFMLLEQRKLVSPEASETMHAIFESPDVPHDDIKFIKGLDGRGLDIIRKWGSWENWLHDSAVITGPGRHYVLVALTEHPKGDEYLVELAKRVDDLMSR